MSIRAGIATQDITPQDHAYIAGYTGAPRLSTGVRDKIFASATHLRGGSGGVIILSLDLLILDTENIGLIRGKIAEATGTPEQNIFIGTTGTHSAPATGRNPEYESYPGFAEQRRAYLDFLTEQALRAASESTVTSRPATVAKVDLDEPNNGAIFVKDESSNRIIAVITVHNRVPDTLGPENTEISSDFVQPLRTRLTARFGTEPAVVFFTGPPSDINPEPTTDDTDVTGTGIANTLVEKLKTLKSPDFSANIRFEGKLIAEPQNKVTARLLTIGETNILGIPGLATKASEIAAQTGYGSAWICGRTG